MVKADVKRQMLPLEGNRGETGHPGRAIQLGKVAAGRETGKRPSRLVVAVGGKPQLQGKAEGRKRHGKRAIQAGPSDSGKSLGGESETARQTEVRATVEPENSGEGPSLAVRIEPWPARSEGYVEGRRRSSWGQREGRGAAAAAFRVLLKRSPM